MKHEENSTAAVMLAGWCVIASTILFRGYSGVMLSMIPLAAAAGFSYRTGLFRVVLVLMLIAFASLRAMPWAVLMGGTLCAVLGKDIASRTSGFLSVVFVLWFAPLQAAVPLAVVAASGALFPRDRRMAYYVLPGVFLLSVFCIGLPHPLDQEPSIAGSLIENGQIEYNVVHLNTFRREVKLPAPCEGQWAMWVAVDGGGIRDTLPMMAVCLGEDMLFLAAGRDTLCFEMTPDDTLFISLLREFKPFNHSVVHITAGGERI